MLSIMIPLILSTALMLAIDWCNCRSRPIRFCRIGSPYWEIARGEDGLRQKLDGQMATVVMPAKPLVVRLWRLLSPPRAIETN